MMNRIIVLGSFVFLLALASCGWIISESNDATLKSFKISSGTLDPTFTPGETSYKATVADDTVEFTPIANNVEALIFVKVNEGPYLIIPHNADVEVLLDMGKNTILFKVIAADGAAFLTYKVVVNRVLASDPDLDPESATIAVVGSPLTLTTNGPTGTLTITNTSLTLTATNISSDFTGTALDGEVTETGNTCASIPPSSSCTLTYTPGSTVVPETSFAISGSNTNTLTAAIQIDAGVTVDSINASSGPASGGSGFTITGSGLTGATDVTFGGTAATSVNVVSSTTLTGVTPVHAVGSVDVVVTTPSGSGTLINGYTYLTTAVGQSSNGGAIACLNGGVNNLIAAIADNSIGHIWGGFGTSTSATSTTDGATNTATIENCLTNSTAGGCPGNISANSYAAGLCSIYEIDSQGNTPCQVGNTCYNDWFLPAGNNLGASGQLNCIYTNRVAIGGFASATYTSSTEFNANNAWAQNFSTGAQTSASKSASLRTRCVRAFTP